MNYKDVGEVERFKVYARLPHPLELGEIVRARREGRAPGQSVVLPAYEGSRDPRTPEEKRAMEIAAGIGDDDDDEEQPDIPDTSPRRDEHVPTANPVQIRKIPVQIPDELKEGILFTPKLLILSGHTVKLTDDEHKKLMTISLEALERSMEEELARLREAKLK